MKYIAVSNPKAYEDWENQQPIGGANTVYEREESPVDTGLIDSNGIRLFRVMPKPKMGYL